MSKIVPKLIKTINHRSKKFRAFQKGKTHACAHVSTPKCIIINILESNDKEEKKRSKP